jgi:hypothetical protein
MHEYEMVIEEIKSYLKASKSDVAELRNNVHPTESRYVEDTIDRINYVQGLLNDLQYMLETYSQRTM